jgi:hypothetical protein
MPTKLVRYDVISPDGIPIAANGYYPTKQAARDALKKWKSHFEHQGYYSTIIHNRFARIPLDELEHFCKIIKVK